MARNKAAADDDYEPVETAEDLRLQAADLMRRADEKEQAELDALFSGVMRDLSNEGKTLDELVAWAEKFKKKPAAKRVDLNPKYKGPNGELWAGRGHHPHWLKEAVAAGKTKEDFAIK